MKCTGETIRPAEIYVRNHCALMATMIVLIAMKTAPTAGERKKPMPAVHPGGQGDRDDVVAGRPPQVLHHLGVRGPRQSDDRDDVGRIAPDQHDIGRFDRDIGARPDGDPQIGLDQGGRVVDAVATMATVRPRCFTRGSSPPCLSGRTSAKNSSSPNSRATACATARLSPSKHHAGDAHCLQAPDRLARLGPDDIGQRNRADADVRLAQHVDHRLRFAATARQAASSARSRCCSR